MTTAEKKKQIIAMFGVYSKRMEKLYSDFTHQLTLLAHKVHTPVKDMLAIDPLFHFDDYPELKTELNNIFSDYVQKEMLCYRAGITDGVALAYSHDNATIGAFSILSDKAIRQARNTAAETFLRNRMKTSEGLNLSQLVWNYAQQSKSEFEVAMSNVIADGLKKGTSAETLGREVRQYLNNPDMMYRRYHRTVVDAQGNKKDIVRWRRRIIDEDGKVRFVEQPLEKVGMGHYRSSRMNSFRLMRTEINMAYHRANSDRWQREPFVIGINIELSPQHPVYDMCDELVGRYPKDFIFIGFHVACLCMASPITLQGEEKDEFYKRLAAGEDMSNYHSRYEVKDIPDKAKAWIDDNREKFIRAGERGKLGYIWRENMKYVGKQFSAEELAKMGYTQQPVRVKRVKTEAEKADIQRRWDERKAKNALIIKTGNNVWKVADKLDYAEISGMRSILRSAIFAEDYKNIPKYTKALAKSIANINANAKMLEEYVPNAKTWLKEFTVSDLKTVRDSFINNMQKWGEKYFTDSYIKSKYANFESYIISKLQTEALYVTDANFIKPHTLYNTSKVAESVYLNEIKVQQFSLEKKALLAQIDEIKNFSLAHPKATKLAKKVHEIMDKAESLSNVEKDISLLKKNIAEAQKDVDKLKEKQVQKELKERSLRLQKEIKERGLVDKKLYTGGTPFTEEEMLKLAEYETKIIDQIFATGRWDNFLTEEYREYALKLAEKYYDKQRSLFSAAENKRLKKVTSEYLSHSNAEPRYIWNGSLGGVYNDENKMWKTEEYLAKGLIKGVSKEEISIVQRFTNGSTFSNCYNLYKESSYWRTLFKEKFANYIENLSQAKMQFQYIEEWSQGANYVLDKMVRYNGVTFRGLNAGGGPELRASLKKAFETNKPWVNNASCSTSLRASKAEDFDGDIILVVHNKTGAYIHPVSEYSSEYEVMTLRGAKYKVLRPPVKVGSRYFCEIEETL